jgi:hypothetical protein
MNVCLKFNDLGFNNITSLRQGKFDKKSSCVKSLYFVRLIKRLRLFRFWKMSLVGTEVAALGPRIISGSQRKLLSQNLRGRSLIPFYSSKIFCQAKIKVSFPSKLFLNIFRSKIFYFWRFLGVVLRQ